MLFLGLISTDLVAKGDQLKRKVTHAEVPPPNPGAHPGTNDIAVLTLSEPLDFDSEEPWPTSGLPICTGRFFWAILYCKLRRLTPVKEAKFYWV